MTVFLPTDGGPIGWAPRRENPAVTRWDERTLLPRLWSARRQLAHNRQLWRLCSRVAFKPTYHVLLGLIQPVESKIA
ncbi:hypothetical protein GGR16_000246 [Chelatococcus caeni]|uniref:Uncharacterized protein n=1 Tax=Chelatococcus caeni TaxID=1348468 RepID=A0A840BQI8_9HYPH|nr:hypothetical protein [Chelatococcus caeni]